MKEYITQESAKRRRQLFREVQEVIGRLMVYHSTREVIRLVKHIIKEIERK